MAEPSPPWQRGGLGSLPWLSLGRRFSPGRSPAARHSPFSSQRRVRAERRCVASRFLRRRVFRLGSAGLVWLQEGYKEQGCHSHRILNFRRLFFSVLFALFLACACGDHKHQSLLWLRKCHQRPRTSCDESFATVNGSERSTNLLLPSPLLARSSAACAI